MTKVSNYFLDTEFFDPTGDGFSLDFISIGLVAQHGDKEFYGVYDQINDDKYRGLWLHEHVISKLPPLEERMSLPQIRQGILETFESSKPQSGRRQVDIWARNGAYDFFILCRLFEGMSALRQTLHQSCKIDRITFRDTKEVIRLLPSLFPWPEQNENTLHISIDDARNERDCFNSAMGFLDRRAAAKTSLAPEPR